MLRYGQGHIVLVALGLAGGTLAVLGGRLDWPLVLVVALGAWGAYAGERLWVDAPEDRLHRPARAAWFGQHRQALQRATVGVALIVGGLLLFLPARAQILAGVTALLGIGYAFVPAIRRHPLGKPAAIALAWTFGGVLLPLSASRAAPALGTLALYAAARAATVAANVILCDWPDRAGDAAAGRRTVAVAWGASGVRWAAGGLLVLALALDLSALQSGARGGTPLLGLVGPVGLLGACAMLPRPGEGPRVWLDLLVGASGLAALG